MVDKIICPYCFENIKKKNILFRCQNEALDINGDRKCKQEPDQEYSEYKGVVNANNVIYMNRVFGGSKFGAFGVPKEAKCPECNKISRKHICSFCHNDFPESFTEIDNLNLAVIGAKETGKSHYIAVLKTVLEDIVSNSFGFAMRAGNDKTIERYRNDFKKNVYDNHMIIPATQSAKVDKRVKEPLIYRFSFFDKNKKITKVVTITFFDTAGEDLNDEDLMSVENKYIYKADGIILLLDPLQLPGLRSQIPSGVNLPAINTEINDIIDRVSNLIKRANNIGIKDKIKIPLAVAFTKMDVVEPLLPPSSQFHNQGNHANLGIFDVNDFENINAEMESLINRWAGGGLLGKVSAEFEKYAYFGLSALGCNPNDFNGTIDKVIPMRVEDPFLWLLWILKYVKGTK